MFNRRFLRIKVFQQLYAFSREEQSNVTAHEKHLLNSVSKAYDCYTYLLGVTLRFRDFAQRQLDAEKDKFIPNPEATPPFRQLVANTAIALLDASEFLHKQIKQYATEQSEDVLLRSFWNQIKDNGLFAPAYQPGQLAVDKRWLGEFVQVLIGESDLFNAHLEDVFMSWEDDQVAVTTLVLRTIEQIKDNQDDSFVFRPLSDEEDIAFMRDLFSKTITSDEELTKLIAEKTKNWDPDRIASSDMIMMKMALCELLYFPYVPVKVSINEYLELAKLYSTPNSHGFINGILDKLQLDLKKGNRIEKLGRGLVE